MRKHTIIILLLSWSFLFAQFQDLTEIFKINKNSKLVKRVSDKELQLLVETMSVKIIIQIGKNKQALLKQGEKSYFIKEKAQIFIPLKGGDSFKKNFEVFVINKRSVILKHIQTQKYITIL